MTAGTPDTPSTHRHVPGTYTCTENLIHMYVVYWRSFENNKPEKPCHQSTKMKTMPPLILGIIAYAPKPNTLMQLTNYDTKILEGRKPNDTTRTHVASYIKFIEHLKCIKFQEISYFW